MPLSLPRPWRQHVLSTLLLALLWAAWLGPSHGAAHARGPSPGGQAPQALVAAAPASHAHRASDSVPHTGKDAGAGTGAGPWPHEAGSTLCLWLDQLLGDHGPAPSLPALPAAPAPAAAPLPAPAATPLPPPPRRAQLARAPPWAASRSA